MANIIEKIGTYIAKNRAEVKTILNKHNILTGESNSDRIRAAFTAIKEGNTSLATDLAALSLKSSFTKKPKDINNLRLRVDEIKAKIVKDRPKTINNSTFTTTQKQEDPLKSNLDGFIDPISADSAELIGAIRGADIETTVTQADTSAKSADLSDTKTMIALGLVAAVIIFALIDPMKYFKPVKSK